MSWRNNRAVTIALICGFAACYGGTPDREIASGATDPDHHETSESVPTSERNRISAGLEYQSRLNPGDRQLRVRLAEAYLEEGNFIRAVEISRKLSAGSPAAGRARFILAQALYRSAENDAPETTAFLALISEADSIAATAGISSAMDTFRRQTAERRADGWKSRSPNTAIRYYDLAATESARWKAIALLVEQRRFTEVMTRARSIMRTQPSNHDAMEAIRIARKLNPEQAGCWAALYHPDLLRTDQVSLTSGAVESSSVRLAFLRGAARADSSFTRVLLETLLHEKRITEAVALLDRASPALTGIREEASFNKLLLDAAIDSGRKEKALSILLSLDDASREMYRSRAESVAILLLRAGNMEAILALANRFAFNRALHETIAAQLYRRGRAADAMRFDDSREEIRAMAAFQRGDTPQAIRELDVLRRAGRITSDLLAVLRQLESDPNRKRLLTLALHLRGRVPADARDLRSFHSPLSRVILAGSGRSTPAAGLSNRVIAEAYMNREVPGRARRYLLAELRHAPSARSILPLLVRACRLAGDTATAFIHVQEALRYEPYAADLNVIAYERDKLGGDRGLIIARLERLGSLPGVAARQDIKLLINKELPRAYTAEAAAQFKNRGYALAYLRKARALDEEDPTIPFNIAMIHSLNGEVDSAIAAIDDCFRISDNDIDALILAASLFKRRGRNDDAAAAYQKALQCGASVQVRHDLALLMQNQGETAGAFVAAAEARRLDPSSVRIARTFGVLAAHLGKWSEAMEPLKQSQAAFPHDREAQFLLARTSIECGEIGAGRKLVAALPQPADRVELFARADMKDGRPFLAVTALRPHAKAPRVRELFIRALAEAADQMLTNGRMAEARSLWREWIALDSSAAIPQTLLAAAAPALTPPAPASQATVLSGGGAAGVKTGAGTPPAPRILPATRPASARPDTHQAVMAAVPRHADSSIPILRVPVSSLKIAAEAMKAGKFATAESLARKIIEDNHSNATAWNLLGLALSRQGRQADAVNAFRESLRIRPDQPEVRAVLDEMESTG
ncbi:MAG: tetratricopeptide repeat protein [Candidatus Hydrogenedentota bacterium]